LWRLFAFINLFSSVAAILFGDDDEDEGDGGGILRKNKASSIHILVLRVWTQKKDYILETWKVKRESVRHEKRFKEDKGRVSEPDKLKSVATILFGT
jgi:hypothetical protein